MSEALDREQIKRLVDQALSSDIDVFPVGYRLDELVDLEALESAAQGITDPLGQLAQFITDLANTLTSWLAEAIPAAVKGFIDWLWKQINNLLGGLPKKVEEMRDKLLEVGKTLEGFVNAILRFPEWFPNWFKENIADPISDAIADLAKKIWDMLPDWLKSVLRSLENFFKDPVGTLRKGLEGLAEQIWNLLPDWLRNALEGAKKAVEDLAKTIENALREFAENPVEFIRKRFEELARFIWDLLPDWLKDALERVREFFENLWNSLQEFFRNPAEWIKARFRELASFIWNLLPDWAKDAIEWLKSMAQRIVEELKEFWENPGEWIREKFEWLAKKIWELLPDWLKGAIDTVKQWFENLWNSFREFLANPWEFLKNWIWSVIEFIWSKLPEALRNWLLSAWDLITRVWEWFRTAVLETFESIYYAITDFGKFVSEKVLPKARRAVEVLVENTPGAALGLLKRVGGTFLDAAKAAAQLLVEPIVGLFHDMFETLRAKYDEAIEGKITLEDFIREFFVAIIPYSLTIAATVSFIHAVGEEIDAARGIALSLLSAAAHGGEGSFVRALSRTLEEGAWRIVVELPWGLAFWFAESLRKPVEFAMRYYWRNDVPVEIPTISEGREMVQRFMPHAKFSEILEDYRTWLALRGYSDGLIRLFSATPEEKVLEEEAHVVVRDRFGQPRKYPLSLLYDIPTASEMCRMMVRDIFAGPEEFTKAILMRGFVPDIAYMYYLLHFRYPSPEKLWDFVTRGIAGMLWFEPGDEAVKEAEEEAKKIGAFKPHPPTEFNFDAPTLFRALTTYMKWHDYARFAWIEGFTSDNWIYIDCLADIPTKIDVRWMTKWGLFDFMASKQIGIKTAVREFAKVVEGRAANPKVTMDLRLMARLLQATGLHPYYVPIVSVAETINALADERTLLRTGLINMYEYGATTYEELDKIMAHLVTASFHVAYFDMAAGEWKTGWINVPVMYLPAERKLLELRALIDRYLRIFRDALHDLERAYAEYIIEAGDVGVKMAGVVAAINGPFGKATEDVVGRSLKFAVDAEYVSAALAAWSLARDIYTVRRIRSWVYRVLAWVIYRLGYGWVTLEDAKELARTFADVARLPPEEEEAIYKIMERMVGIARREYAREYIPTPSMVASMAEYVPAVRAYLEEVFEARNVPAEWRPVWRRYVYVRPLVDEVRAVVSSTRRLYEYFMINVDMWKKFLSALGPWGYEDAEIKLMQDRANLDRWYRAYRELVGSPRQLVTMAEYVPAARRLALAEVKKRIDALPIPEDAKRFLYQMWEDYIRIRPVYDEVRREVTELINDYAQGVIDDAYLDWALNELKKWGLDDYEIDAVKFIAFMRRQRYMRRAGVS